MHLIPIHSIYTWQGEIVDDDEVLLIVKARAQRFRTESLSLPPVAKWGGLR